jgi:hypothetical protein
VFQTCIEGDAYMDWEKIKFGLLSAAGGAIVVAVIGFNWGGWVTTDSAEAMAKGRCKCGRRAFGIDLRRAV